MMGNVFILRLDGLIAPDSKGYFHQILNSFFPSALCDVSENRYSHLSELRSAYLLFESNTLNKML